MLSRSTLFEPSNSAMAPSRMYLRTLQSQLQAAVQAQVVLSLEWRTSSLSTFVWHSMPAQIYVCDRGAISRTPLSHVQCD